MHRTTRATYTGFRAAACTLSKTSPGPRSDGTGAFWSNTSAFLGFPLFTTTQALCFSGIVVLASFAVDMVVEEQGLIFGGWVYIRSPTMTVLLKAETEQRAEDPGLS